MMALLVSQGFTRREMLDEVRPGRPYPGWSVREFIYLAQKAARRARSALADHADMTRLAVTCASATTGMVKKQAAEKVIAGYKKAISDMRKD